MKLYKTGKSPVEQVPEKKLPKELATEIHKIIDTDTGKGIYLDEAVKLLKTKFPCTFTTGEAKEQIMSVYSKDYIKEEEVIDDTEH